MNKTRSPIYLLILTAFLLGACDRLDAEVPALAPGQDNPAEQSSGQDDLDYAAAFPQEAVNEITITISPENWQVMMDDMTDLYGDQGTGGSPGGGQPGIRPRDGQRPPGMGDNPGQGAPLDRQPGAAGLGGGLMGGNDDLNPVWVEAQFSFGGETWEHIGIRFKGNSSLRSTWSAGSLKLPFKLDFDQYEDSYPETNDQRFFGFKQLSFSSNFRDASYLREKIAADLFREAGVPAPQTAFYAVTIDYGEGPVYLGLYTAVEVVDDTLIETQFQYDQGNLYKPEGIGATFSAGSFTEASFDKETNQELDDYDDILALYNALHAENRTTDPETWRRELEAVFDVDTFLNWLAVNTVIQNWDTYGVMNHNYYLYHNPDTGQLVWIPWDNNESLKSSGGINDPLPLDLSGVGEEWPLISFLRDDAVYYQRYLDFLQDFLELVFLPGELQDRLEGYHDLLQPYIAAETEHTIVDRPGSERDSSLEGLIDQIWDRYRAAGAFIAAASPDR